MGPGIMPTAWMGAGIGADAGFFDARTDVDNTRLKGPVALK